MQVWNKFKVQCTNQMGSPFTGGRIREKRASKVLQDTLLRHTQTHKVWWKWEFTQEFFTRNGSCRICSVGMDRLEYESGPWCPWGRCISQPSNWTGARCRPFPARCTGEQWAYCIYQTLYCMSHSLYCLVQALHCLLSHPTNKTHCRMNEISRKFPDSLEVCKNGKGGEGASQTRRKWVD